MKLFITNTEKIDLRYAGLLEDERQKKVQRLRLVDDKKRCIAAGLLLRHFFSNSQIVKNKNGKPYVKNGQFFNISHSGEYVLFALSDSEVGCDIERVHYADSQKIGKTVFTENEMKLLLSSKDRLGVFFDLWTKKESLLKCLGEGFHRSAKSVDVCSDVFEEKGKSYFLKTWNFSDYTVSVCSLKDDFPKYIEFIGTQELLLTQPE